MISNRGRHVAEWSHHYSLTQRVACGAGDLGDRIDLDNAGHTALEHDSLQRSLERMRACQCAIGYDVVTTPYSIVWSVSFIGPECGLDDKIIRFQQSVPTVCSSRGLRFPDDITKGSSCCWPYPGWHDLSVALWFYEADVILTLRRDVAEELLYGLEHPMK